MGSLVQLPRILCQEEREAFSKTIDRTDLDHITKLHNVSGFDISPIDFMTNKVPFMFDQVHVR